MADLTPKDWKALVRKHLHPLDLPEDLAEEVIAELAAHLEDLYEEQIAQGLSASEAQQTALNEIANSHPLARNIQRAKYTEGIMNARTKHFWLPGLVSLGTSMLALFFATVYAQPRVYFAQHQETTLYLPWLAVLPLCGAAGAWLSRRSGGDRLACFASSQFTSAAWLSCFCFVFLVSMFLEGDRALTLTSFLLFTFNWVLLPGGALLLGALPFLVNQSPVRRS
jgi:hypothetical protein